MNKKLFYVVDLELQHVDGEIQETTGWKYVRVYEIVENDLSSLCALEIDITDNSEEAIQEYLDEIEMYNDITFEFIEL